MPGSTSGSPVTTPVSVSDSTGSTDMPRVTVGASPVKSKPLMVSVPFSASTSASVMSGWRSGAVCAPACR